MTHTQFSQPAVQATDTLASSSVGQNGVTELPMLEMPRRATRRRAVRVAKRVTTAWPARFAKDGESVL